MNDLGGMGAGRPARPRGIRRPPSGRPPAPRNDPQATDGIAAGRVFRVVATVIAPTTLLTSLMFYLGTQHAFWFFQYFGVNYTILDLTAADFLQRAVDGLFVPLLLVAVAVSMAIWVHRIVGRRLGRWAGRRGRQVASAVCALLGVLGLAVAAVGVRSPGTFAGLLALPGLVLVAGALLLVAASHGWRSIGSRPVSAAGLAIEWAAAFVVVGVGLFWAAGDYSAAVGTSRGAQLQALLPTWPSAVVYSTDPLFLPPDAAQSVTCTASEEGFRYRYQGLRLVFASSSQYVLLPGGWRPGAGAAVLLPRGDSVRLEFRTGDSPPPTC
jgi:hypothetical protein